MTQQDKDSNRHDAVVAVDFCRTRTLLRAVLLSLWLSLCFSLLQASGQKGLWQAFTATSLFLLWTSLLLSLLLCLLQPTLYRLPGWRRSALEVSLAVALVALNSALALWLMPGFFLDQPGVGWFVWRNLLLTALLLPGLLHHPWLGAGVGRQLDEDAVVKDASTSVPVLEDALLIKAHGNLLRINLDEVRYFYADQKYVTARGPKQEYIVDQSLKQLEERFGEHVFRVHRGYLVVSAYIRGMQSDSLGRIEVIVQDRQERVPVSRRYAPALRQFLKGLSGA